MSEDMKIEGIQPVVIDPIGILPVEGIKSVFPSEEELKKHALEGVCSPYFKGLVDITSISPIIADPRKRKKLF
jgi:hypothetical protein